MSTESHSPIWLAGYSDGHTATLESGTNRPPHGGWASWCIEGIGLHAFLEDVLHMPLDEEGDEDHTFWETPERSAACREYNEGAQAGADAALREQPASDWAVLERVLPHDCAHFMFMDKFQTPDGFWLYLYKHETTRRYLNVDTAGRYWRYDVAADTSGFPYHETNPEVAIRHVFK